MFSIMFYLYYWSAWSRRELSACQTTQTFQQFLKAKSCHKFAAEARVAARLEHFRESSLFMFCRCEKLYALQRSEIRSSARWVSLFNIVHHDFQTLHAKFSMFLFLSWYFYYLFLIVYVFHVFSCSGAPSSNME